MTEKEIIDYAINALNELDPQKQQDDEIILQWVIDKTKKLCAGENDVLHGVMASALPKLEKLLEHSVFFGSAIELDHHIDGEDYGELFNNMINVLREHLP